MFKKVISIVLCLSQVSLAFVASVSWAGTPVAVVDQDSEITLLSQVIGLQGQGLSQADLQKQLNSAVTEYTANAPEDGRMDRLEQALVSMQIFTPDQAAAFAMDVQTSAQQLASSPMLSQESVALEMQRLAGLHPAGAQFSSADAYLMSDVMVGVGIVILVVGIVRGPDSLKWPATGAFAASYALVMLGNSLSDSGE